MKASYKVTFDLTFKGDGNEGSPYNGQRIIETVPDEERLLVRLEEELRRFFAGINEFPEDVVRVKVTQYERIT